MVPFPDAQMPAPLWPARMVRGIAARTTKMRGGMPDLLSRIAQDRSAEAFQELFQSFGPRLKGYMMRLGADAATAEDLAQDTLLAVWRKAALYSPDKGTPSTWIFTIARNLRIDRLRRETNWHELSDEQAATIPSDEAPPDDIASDNQRKLRVQAVISALPPEQQEIVILAFVDGLSHSEIASRLSVPLGTVKSRMRLAYDKVRTALKDLK